MKKQQIRIPLLLLFCSLLLSAGSYAQEEPLLLKDALQYALKNSSDAKKAALDVENSEYKIDETLAGALPQVSGTASLVDQYKKQKFVLDGAIMGNPGTVVAVESGTTWNAAAGLNLDQKLFDRSVFIGLKAAKTTRQFYQLNAQLTDEQIIELVATAYFNVLVQRQKMNVVDTNIRNTTQTHDIIDNLFKNGLAKKIDLDRTVVNLYNLKTQRQQLLNAVTQQENTLKFYMGMPIDEPVLIPSSELDNINPSAELLDANADVTERTEYLVLKKQSEMLRFQKESYKSAHYPTLSLNGNYNVNGVNNEFILTQNKNWFGFGSVGLNLKVPLFNGNATRSRIRQADVSIRKNEEEIRNTTRSLNLASANAKTQISNSLITISNQKENEKLAQEVYENTQNNYRNGLATLSDLLDSQSALAQAQNNYTAALLDYKLAEIQLIKSLGKLKSLLN